MCKRNGGICLIVEVSILLGGYTHVCYLSRAFFRLCSDICSAVFIPAFAQVLLSSPWCNDTLNVWSVLLAQPRVTMNIPPVSLS